MALTSDGETPGSTAVVEIRLLGRFTVEHDGREIAPGSFGGRLARRLLRLLTLRRGTLVPKELIVCALWPDAPPADPAGNIEVLVSRIRRALGDRTLIRASSGGYILAGGDRCWVDVENFLAAVRAGQASLATRPGEALPSFRTALDIWRGDPLPEDTYADWAAADRRRLSLSYLEALDGAAAAALESRGTGHSELDGAAAEAASWARQALAADPLRESSVLLLVRALGAVGNQAGALAAFDEYRDRLAAETGLKPTPAARQARQHLLAGRGDGAQPVPARWREMLCLLSLLGRPASPALLATAAGTSLHSALDTLEGLGSAGFASPRRQGWALSRGLGRQAITATMSPAETARYHALLAQALGQYGDDPAETATHLAASGDSSGAARAYATAARRQLDRICDREAMRLAEDGLLLEPGGRTRAVLLEVRGEARRRAGQFAAARADFAAALDGFDDPASRSSVLTQLAILDARTADAARGGELAKLAIAEAGDQTAALGQALAAGAIIDLARGNLARARYRARRAGRLLDQAGDSRGSARLLYWQAMACFIDGKLRAAADRLDRLTRLAVMPGEVLRLWSPRACYGHALVFLGQPADGLPQIEEALAGASAVRHPAVEVECLWRRAEALAALGRGDEAVESAAEAASVAARIGHAEWTAAAYRGLGIACETAGLPGRAEAAYRDSLRFARGIPLFLGWAEARLGAFLARQGKPAAAAPHVQAALAGGVPLTCHEARWAQAELLASQGDGAASRAAAASALRQAQADGYLILAPRLRELAGC